MCEIILFSQIVIQLLILILNESLLYYTILMYFVLGVSVCEYIYLNLGLFVLKNL